MSDSENGTSSDSSGSGYSRRRVIKCALCRNTHCTEVKFTEHLRSNKHIHKVQNVVSKNFQCYKCKMKLNSARKYDIHMCAHMKITSEADELDHMALRGVDREMCKGCDSNKFQSVSDAISHYTGTEHILSTFRKHCKVDIIKSSSDRDTSFGLVSTPHPYQIELYKKIIGRKDSCICYLPTGCGKTLVSAMVIKKMLKLNSSKYVYFITDRFLLLFQQFEYLRKQLGNDYKIAVIAGDKFLKMPTDTYKISECNVLLFTADALGNLLNLKNVQWHDASLIIFDEVHHCEKNHPFFKLIEDYHNCCEEEKKPKLLGLTASPTDKYFIGDALSSLEERLKKFDNAKLVSVTEENDSLTSVQPKVEFIVVKLDEDVREVIDNLKNAFQSFFVKGMSEYSNIEKTLEQILKQCERDDNWECMMLLLKNQASEDKEISKFLTFMTKLSELVNLLTIFKPLDCKECLDEVIGRKCNFSIFDNYKDVEYAAEHYKKIKDSSSTYDTIVGLILNKLNAYQSMSKHLFTLLITKTRATAVFLEQLLSKDPKITSSQIIVHLLTGHGSSKPTHVKGMKISRQKSALESAHNEGNQIFIATSVVEEGIDIPTCGLLIALSPPATGTAFVQLKGRTRQEDSEFYMLFNSEQKTAYLNRLSTCEHRMEAAVRQLTC